MKNVLKRYLHACNAKAVDLSEKSEISLATISRYLSGMRVPEIDGENIVKLSHGLFLLLEEHGGSTQTEEDILQELKDSVYTERPDLIWEMQTKNLDKLILQMGISKAAFADEMFYSASALTRILSGDSKPRNMRNFVSRAADIVCQRYSDEDKFEELRDFLQRETGAIAEDAESAHLIIEQWLLRNTSDDDQDDSGSFLKTIAEFDYETYMAGVDTDAVDRIPMTKIRIPVTKTFSGQAGMERGILDFLRATVTSSSHEPIFIYSDHPIEHLTQDPDTIENWKKALGAAILQGKHVNILHNMNRPYEEMMLGIESWLPLYMTGNIQSYYSEQSANQLFSHILMVSGAAVFSGFAAGAAEGQYVFSKNTSRISEGRRNAENLLAESNVLVETFNPSREAEYRDYLIKNASNPGSRIAYSDSLPVYTLSDELLDRMLAHNKVDAAQAPLIKEDVRSERDRLAVIAGHSSVTEVVLKQNGFGGGGAHAYLRTGEDTLLRYEGDEYAEHLRLTEEFAKKHKNYHFVATDDYKYRNIRIMVQSATHAIISRSAGSTLHLMVQHPRLVESIERELRSLI